MCECYDYEEPTLYTEAERKARKTHTCCECRGEIKPGESYLECSGLWDGEFSRFRMCGECRAKRDELLTHNCACCEFGGLLEAYDEMTRLAA